MGASDFQHSGRGKTASAVFEALTSQSRFESGHSYSGAIGMKNDFVMIQTPAGLRATTLAKIPAAVSSFAYATQQAGDDYETERTRAAARRTRARLTKTFPYLNLPRLADAYENKWGPALCLALPNDRYIFFGLASS